MKVDKKPGEFASDIWEQIPPDTLLIDDKGVLVIVVDPGHLEPYIVNCVCVCTTGQIHHHSNHTGLRSV